MKFDWDMEAVNQKAGSTMRMPDAEEIHLRPIF